MTAILEHVERARRSGDVSALVDLVPYAKFLGLSAELQDGEPLGVMKFAPHQVGNALIPALHGGAISALLETTAAFKLVWEIEVRQMPRIINVTLEFLRTGRTQDTFARGEIARRGRRVATVRVVAWQDEPEAPIASAITHFLL